MRETRSLELAAAYRFCRDVARREAKNFYWAFRALPRHKSDAMCAVYAFMRRADDLADDESTTVEARREAMSAWTAAWRQSREGGTTDPLFLALNDTQQRFGIPTLLLEQLVAGTTMDLQPQLEGTVLLQEHGAESGTGRTYLGYTDFEALYRYCYLVASVVGLVTIRIFGYSDPAAEGMAERTGIAFQLTNILRDVREDLERGRVYLPEGALARSGVSLRGLEEACASGSPSPELAGLLLEEIGRAEEFYHSGYALLPLIDRDARPAMRVLIAIYHRLLRRIAKDPAAVFRGRVSVPTAHKLLILGRGLAGSMWARWT